MKIQAINNSYNSNRQNFGMAIKATPEAKEMLNKGLTRKAVKKLEELKKIAEKDTVDVNIVTEEMSWGGLRPELTYPQLVVEVGDGSQYSYRPVLNIIRQIKKAVRKAHELSENQKIINNL